MASVLLRLTLVCSFLFTDGAIKVRYGETVMVQFKATKRQRKESFFLVWGDFLTNPINTKSKVKSFIGKEVKAAMLTTYIMPLLDLHHT